jgi:hypothetical protein
MINSVDFKANNDLKLQKGNNYLLSSIAALLISLSLKTISAPICASLNPQASAGIPQSVMKSTYWNPLSQYNCFIVRTCVLKAFKNITLTK